MKRSVKIPEVLTTKENLRVLAFLYGVGPSGASIPELSTELRMRFEYVVVAIQTLRAVKYILLERAAEKKFKMSHHGKLALEKYRLDLQSIVNDNEEDDS